MGEQGPTEYFNGLRVPEGTGRRELYRSQYRLTFAYKAQINMLTQQFDQICQQDQWAISDDDRVDGVGTLTVRKGAEEVKVSFEEYPEPNICALKFFLNAKMYSKAYPPSPMRQ